jgi:hypothetical protein
LQKVFVNVIARLVSPNEAETEPKEEYKLIDASSEETCEHLHGCFPPIEWTVPDFKLFAHVLVTALARIDDAHVN